MISVKVKVENEEQSSNGSSFNDYNDVKLTMRILIDRREVRNVIGKGGESSGAKVLISGGQTRESIVSITGTTNAICKATELIGLKVEEFFERQNGPKAFLTLKLIVPISQCGFIIGKGGCKIKEIRESSGAAIQVALDMLPNSTERLVSITGTTGTISQCVYQVCNVILNSPSRKATIPYDPRRKTLGFASSAVGTDFGRQCINPLASLAALGLGTVSTGSINPATLAALAGSQLRTGNRQNRNGGGEHKNQNSNSNSETISMTVPNVLIGCVIGRRGSKIAEIKQLSGALVYIAKGERTHENGENEDRQITITGNKDSISVAKYLIEMSVELQKANLEGANSSSSPDDESSSALPTPPTVAASPLSSAITLAELFAKPGVINALSSLSALGGLTDFLGALFGANQSSPMQTTGFHRPKNYFQRNCSPSGEKTKADRTKFAPY
ncbi:poly(rC)-binding protein 3-like [Acyrthosiphon pisum]|uniref:K Homology domain-containing protein n=1 Tax=Acyrthosiphon pisum TaxID=7029 RepID=A0A8R2JLC8_ACYPI|nr:poly(rC)-binding protein 3-like [Acyrthosiphon pisum]